MVFLGNFTVPRRRNFSLWRRFRLTSCMPVLALIVRSHFLDIRCPTRMLNFDLVRWIWNRPSSWDSECVKATWTQSTSSSRAFSSTNCLSWNLLELSSILLFSNAVAPFFLSTRVVCSSAPPLKPCLHLAQCALVARHNGQLTWPNIRQQIPKH